MGRERTTGGSLVVCGKNAVEGLLQSRMPASRVIVQRGRDAGLRALAQRRGVPYEEGDRTALDRLAGTPHHQGVVAWCPAYQYASLDDIVTDATSVLVLDSIQDPRNLGAILRTARATGVGGVVLPQDRSAGVTTVAVTASAGCLFDLRIAKVPNLVRAMEALKASGFWLVGLDARGDRLVHDVPVLDRIAIVIGGEGDGLRPLVARATDFRARLPMAPGVESLNVSVAAGVALYELLMRRRDGG
jgi:23S rRNA (guanosine2251-2'-O)-methyltransferase